MISNCRIYIARFDQDFSMKKYGFNKTLGISPWTFGCFQCWFNIVYCKMTRHLNSIYMNTVIWFSPSYCISDIPSWMKRLLLQHPTSKCWLESFRIPCCSFLSKTSGWWNMVKQISFWPWMLQTWGPSPGWGNLSHLHLTKYVSEDI